MLGKCTDAYTAQMHTPHSYTHGADRHEAERCVGRRGTSCPGFRVEGDESCLLSSSVLIIYYCVTSHPKLAMQQPFAVLPHGSVGWCATGPSLVSPRWV